MRSLFRSPIWLVLLLSACAGPEAGTDPITTTTSAASSTTITELPSTTRPVVTATQPVPSTTEASTSTTTLSIRLRDVVLQAEGLGVVSLGEALDTTRPILVALFGEPDDSIVELAPFGTDLPGGYSADTHIEFSSWTDKMLSVVFSDAEFYKTVPWTGDWFDGTVPAGPILIAYRYCGDAYATETGISPGSSLAELIGAYDDVLFQDGDEYTDPRATAHGIEFTLSANSTESGVTVVCIGAGATPSP